MNKIIKQLVKLFPNSYVIVEHKQFRHISTTSGIEQTYKIYVDSPRIYPHGWSKDFKTLKELDTNLVKTVPNYKPVYK
jgi:hypothetical protein